MNVIKSNDTTKSKSLIIKMIYYIKALPTIVLFNISKDKEIVKSDIDRWISLVKYENLHLSYNMALAILLGEYPEFRNLMVYRICNNKIKRCILKVFNRTISTLYIHTPNIGEGLFIQHGFSTIISAKSIGKNCYINQQVTIGYEGNNNPVIGDNVRIAAGAKVIGKCKIGNNCIIGANAVVVKDVPDNCTVVGVPAYIVKRDGKKVRELL